MSRLWAIPLVIVSLSACNASIVHTPAKSSPSVPGATQAAMRANLAPISDLPPAGVPGAANLAVNQNNLQETICIPGYSAKVRPPTSYTEPIKKKLMGEAGIPLSQISQFELDHRWPIEAGGDPDSLAQLWLEPWNGPHSARMKDALENKTHRDLCNGKATLDQVRMFWMGDFWTFPIP